MAGHAKTNSFWKEKIEGAWQMATMLEVHREYIYIYWQKFWSANFISNVRFIFELIFIYIYIYMCVYVCSCICINSCVNFKPYINRSTYNLHNLKICFTYAIISETSEIKRWLQIVIETKQLTKRCVHFREKLAVTQLAKTSSLIRNPKFHCAINIFLPLDHVVIQSHLLPTFTHVSARYISV
jgi:hypothetical protein